MTKVEERFEAGDVKFELVDFFKPDEIFVEGTVMLSRARKMGIKPKQEMIKKLLENKHLLPEELKRFDIVLPGTVKRIGERKIKMISYLCHKGGNWVEGLGGVRYDWGENARLLRA
ncbi:MAG: hypothetical protein ABIG73_01845 [Patescibacteria group bacterium]